MVTKKKVKKTMQLHNATAPQTAPRTSQTKLLLANEIIEVITNHGKISFSSALRNNLRVMSALNSLYFTISDITLFIRDEYLKPYPHLQTKEALSEFNLKSAITLSAIARNRTGETAIIQIGKISHNNPEAFGPKTNGYRFGMATAALHIDRDQVDSQASHAEQFASVMNGSTVMEGLSNAIKELDYGDCATLINLAQQRQSKLFKKVKDVSDNFAADRLRQLTEELESLQRQTQRKH